MSEKTVYTCADREHGAWVCAQCGYIEDFEADGPEENGWRFCPACGREIEFSVDAPCPFDNADCICQFCEEQCCGGDVCAECRRAGKAMRSTQICLGFEGDFGRYIRNWVRLGKEASALRVQ